MRLALVFSFAPLSQSSYNCFKIPATSPNGGLSAGECLVQRSIKLKISAPHDSSFRGRLSPALMALISGGLKPVFWLRGTSANGSSLDLTSEMTTPKE